MRSFDVMGTNELVIHKFKRGLVVQIRTTSIIMILLLTMQSAYSTIARSAADAPSTLTDVEKQLQQKKAAAAQKKREAEDRAAEVQRQADAKRQRVSLQCPALNGDTGQITNKVLEFTLHFIDQSARRPDLYGYYDWEDQRWYSFAGEDINSLWIYKDNPHGSGIHGYPVDDSYTRKCYTCPGGEVEVSGTRIVEKNMGACYRWSKAIDKNTLTVSFYGKLLDRFRSAGNSNSDSYWQCNDAPSRDITVTAQCARVQYRAPPERLGN
jgi:hypothetical protein